MWRKVADPAAMERIPGPAGNYRSWRVYVAVLHWDTVTKISAQLL